MRKILLTAFLVPVSLVFADTTVVALDAVHHYFGSMGNNRTVTDTIQFPHSNSGYSEIIMSIDLECPAGGCDPWDRKAKIMAKHLGEWFEIGRYVTPYGVGCGWTLDVTDYRSILEGDVVLQSYIDTWVQPGWLVTIQFEFISGVPQHPYTSIRNIWNYNYVTYGDPTNPVNISSITEYIPEDTQEGYLRITTTGHGQGNTDNAAEFSNKRHNIVINGETAYYHNFWRPDCEFNDCSPQNGTWQYDRAGFCPGDKVDPQDFTILDHSLPGDTLRLDYVLEDYFNECSPSNPSCVNGVTCSSCNYNNTGHTEPFYLIGSHLILHTEKWHSNADSYLAIYEQDSLSNTIDVYLENYVPVYGMQFQINLDQLVDVDLTQLNFENGVGGRGEEFGWTFMVNESGLVLGLSQGDGNPIKAGEGLLTQISWNGNEFSQISGSISIDNPQVSGYFGSELSIETGEPHTFIPNLNTNEINRLPSAFALHPAYPNPFNPTTQIRYDLSSNENVKIDIYDVMGRKIKSLINKYQVAGHYSAKWNAENELGGPVPAGMYICSMHAGDFRKNIKMILIK